MLSANIGGVSASGDTWTTYLAEFKCSIFVLSEVSSFLPNLYDITWICGIPRVDNKLSYVTTTSADEYSDRLLFRPPIAFRRFDDYSPHVIFKDDKPKARVSPLGVAIGISGDVTLYRINYISPRIISFSYYGKTISLVAAYLPFHTKVRETMYMEMANLIDRNTILAGDFNAVLYKQQRSSSEKYLKHIDSGFVKWTSTLEEIIFFSSCFMVGTDWTYLKKIQGKIHTSAIDHIWITNDLFPIFSHVANHGRPILKNLHPDHCILTLELIPNGSKGLRNTKIRLNDVLHPSFVRRIHREFSSYNNLEGMIKFANRTAVNSKGFSILDNNYKDVLWKQNQFCKDYYNDYTWMSFRNWKNSTNIFNSSFKEEDLVYFWNKLRRVYSSSNRKQTRLLNHKFSHFQSIDFNILCAPITQDEIWYTIEKRAKHPKSHGYTDLPIEFYYIYYDLLAEPLNKSFNSWIFNPIDEFFKIGIVSPISKHKYVDGHLQFRAITLLHNTWKIFTSIFTKRLWSLIDLHPSQIGFSRGKWIHENIVLLDQLIDSDAFVLVIDFSTAFDSISHAWIKKVLGITTDNNWFNLFQNLFAGNSYLQGQDFDPIDMKCGVRQGDVISPLLFNLALDPLLKYLHHSNIGYYLNGYKVSTLAYADDLVLCCKDEAELKELLDILEDFATVSGLKINLDKSGLVNQSSYLIQTLDEFAYLGIYYENRKRTDKNIITKIEKASNAFLPFIKSRPTLVKARLFNTLIGSLVSHYCKAFEYSDDLFDAMERAIKRWFPKFAGRTSSLMAPVKEGGFGVFDLYYNTDKLHRSWLPYLIKNLESYSPFHIIAQNHLSEVRFERTMCLIEDDGFLSMFEFTWNWKHLTHKLKQNYWLEHNHSKNSSD